MVRLPHRRYHSEKVFLGEAVIWILDILNGPFVCCQCSPYPLCSVSLASIAVLSEDLR